MKRQFFGAFALTVVLFGSYCAAAQEENTHLADSVKAELKQELAKFQTFSARFNQTVTDLQGELIQESAGQLRLKRPEKLKWDVVEPDETTILADGESLWHIDPFVEQVTVVDQRGAVQSNPIVLLTQQSDADWAKFSVTKSAGQYHIIPKDESGQIASLSLEFINNQLSSLSIIDKQQQTSVITFTDVAYNIDIADAEFEFQLPDGFDLDDQR